MDEQTAESLLSSAEEARPELTGLDARATLGELERRHADLLAALTWFTDHGRKDEARRLATALAPFWMASKRLDEGVEWLDRTVGLPGGDAVHQGRASYEGGMLAFWRGEDERSSELHNRALELGRQANDATVIALALGGLARIALRTGDTDEARRLCREALEVSDGTADRVGRSGALHVLAVAAQMAGDLAEARELMTERLALMRELENYAGLSTEAGNLSMVERQLGNLDRAEALSREAVEIDRRRGDEFAFAWKLNGLAAVAAERGQLERAATLIGAADALMEAQGAPWPPDELFHYERTVRILTATMGAAAYARARSVGYAMTSQETADFALAAP